MERDLREMLFQKFAEVGFPIRTRFAAIQDAERDVVICYRRSDKRQDEHPSPKQSHRTTSFSGNDLNRCLQFQRGQRAAGKAVADLVAELGTNDHRTRGGTVLYANRLLERGRVVIDKRRFSR